jgi:hypothetical protein
VDYLKSKTGYTCFSRTGRICQLMLRWKNGNGIACPALQYKVTKHFYR